MGDVVERLEGKIIIFLLLLLLLFLYMLIYYNWADYCVTCVQHMFTIDPREEASIYKAWKIRDGKWLRDIFYDIRENDVSTL